MKDWYVVYTKPRQEVIATTNLERQGYNVYCPYIRRTRHQKHRWGLVREPLFPRYAFVCLEQGVDDFSPIRSTLGVIDFVRFGSTPAKLSTNVIESMRCLEEQNINLGCDDGPNWQMGDEIEVLHGPLEGLRGVFLKSSSAERVIVLFDLLGRSTEVLIDVHSLVSA